MNSFRFTLATCLLVLSALGAAAQVVDYPIVEELKWVDKGFLERQRRFVDDLGRSQFGARVRGDKSDLQLLQRILDNNLINQPEKQKLQALGVVLGDVLAREYPLEWRVYLDEYGKSRALCMPDTQDCVFPVTMISKRVALGVTPDISELYAKAVNHVKPLLPRLPYSADK